MQFKYDGARPFSDDLKSRKKNLKNYAFVNGQLVQLTQNRSYKVTEGSRSQKNYFFFLVDGSKNVIADT